jgi:hypothetical protein
MEPNDQIRAAQGPEDRERWMALVMENTKSADDATKHGLLYARLDIEPKMVKTYFGDLEITEAWLESRPHPEVLKKLSETDGKKPEHLTKSHLLLQIRHRRLTVEESTFGGVWFTADEEWKGFTTADRMVRRLRFWSDEPLEVSLTVVQINDLDLSGRKPKPGSGKGLVQTLRLKKKETS